MSSLKALSFCRHLIPGVHYKITLYPITVAWLTIDKLNGVSLQIISNSSYTYVYNSLSYEMFIGLVEQLKFSSHEMENKWLPNSGLLLRLS